MAAYEYIALDARGKQKKGVLEADSVRQIRQLLRDQGLVPLEVDAAREQRATGGFSLADFGRRLGALDRVLFTRQLATLIAAGLPIEEALQAIAQQTEKQSMRSLVMAIRSKLLEGHSLASSLADYPGSFSHLYRSTIAAGEQSGFLDKVLDNLATYEERQFESSRDVEMAMLYPVLLTLFAFGIVGALMVYVVPDMIGVLENMGQELPLSTRILIGMSEFTQSYWWLMLAVVAAVVFGVRFVLQQPGRTPGLGSAEAEPAHGEPDHPLGKRGALRKHPVHPHQQWRATGRGDEHCGGSCVEPVVETTPGGRHPARQRRLEPAGRPRRRWLLSAHAAAYGRQRRIQWRTGYHAGEGGDLSADRGGTNRHHPGAALRACHAGCDGGTCHVHRHGYSAAHIDHESAGLINRKDRPDDG